MNSVQDFANRLAYNLTQLTGDGWRSDKVYERAILVRDDDVKLHVGPVGYGENPTRVRITWVSSNRYAAQDEAITLSLTRPAKSAAADINRRILAKLPDKLKAVKQADEAEFGRQMQLLAVREGVLQHACVGMRTHGPSLAITLRDGFGDVDVTTDSVTLSLRYISPELAGKILDLLDSDLSEGGVKK